MSDFDPGPGWREIEVGTFPQNGEAFVHWAAGPAGPFRDWVREEPVPALPTEPFTVIEVNSTTNSKFDVTPWFLTPNQEWAPIGEYAASLETGLPLKVVTSFRVLAEPRAVTAKAVLDRVMITGISGDAVEALYREFEASDV